MSYPQKNSHFLFFSFRSFCNVWLAAWGEIWDSKNSFEIISITTISQLCATAENCSLSCLELTIIFKRWDISSIFNILLKYIGLSAKIETAFCLGKQKDKPIILLSGITTIFRGFRQVMNDKVVRFLFFLIDNRRHSRGDGICVFHKGIRRCAQQLIKV